jgi:hypothetical protein
MSHAVTHDLCYSVNLDSQLVKTPLNGIFATDDCCAHRFNFPLYKGNAQVKPSAGTTVMGYFTRYKGNTTILFEGELTENTASVELPKACYTQGGRFALVVKLMEDGVISTIFCGEGTVIKSSTDNYVDPDDIIPSLDDLLAQIANMKSATTEAKNATEEVRTVLDDEGGAQVAAIREEGAAQIAAAKTEGAAQILAIEEKGERTRQSIPEDWTTLDADVRQLKNTKAPAIEVEASGSIITVDDAAAMPVHGLVSQIVPVQAGSGDPSPDNVRAISGWTKVNAVRAKKNLYGGLYLANDFAAKINKSVIDTDAKTVSYTAGSIAAKRLYSSFKPGTQYTAIITLTAESTGATTNMRFRYTDGTSSDAFRPVETADSKKQAIVISAPGKSIDYLFGVSFAGVQYLLYEESGIFEGALTADEFVPFDGESISANLPETVYGGTLDWGTGVLTVDHKLLTLDGTETWNAEQKLSTTKAYFWTKIGSVGEMVSYEGLCDRYTYVRIATSTTDIGFMVVSTESRNATCLYVRPDLSVYPDVESWKAYLAEQAAAGTPMQVCYQITQPTTYQLTPQQLETLKGYNNVWSDCGNTSLVYVADTKDWGKGASVALIGATENGMVATKNYSSGEFIVNKETLSMYRATKAIAKGETITPGTNCAATTVVEQLAALYNLINA